MGALWFSLKIVSNSMPSHWRRIAAKVADEYKLYTSSKSAVTSLNSLFSPRILRITPSDKDNTTRAILYILALVYV